jgi:hypothetical protein
LLNTLVASLLDVGDLRQPSVGGSPPLQSMSLVPPCCLGMHFPSATCLQHQRDDRRNAEDC